MRKKEDILYRDFQGWPVYKKNLREILQGLGFENKEGYWQIADNDPKLDEYPVVYHDDGMGYSPYTEYISEAHSKDNKIILWADQKDEKLESKEKVNSDNLE